MPFFFIMMAVGCVVAAVIAAIIAISLIIALLNSAFSLNDDMDSLEEEFDGTYWDDDINDDSFPGMDDEAEIQAVRPVKMRTGKDFTRSEALEIMRGMNPPMKPASLDKCVLWHAENPEYQLTHRTICAAQTMIDEQGFEMLVIFPRGVRSVELDSAEKEYPADTEVLAELI